MSQEKQQQEPTAEELSKMLVSRLAQKVELTKIQKDSLTIIYVQFIDDVKKYRAENNAKVFTYMMNSRDDKIKKLLRDDQKYEKYLIFLEDMKKQPPPQQQRPPNQQQMGGQQNPMGPGGR